ncbi:MAG: YidC/Oxa1 family membrane protein insertase [Armatimonadetes bacterium]|nr:YidC/Oxa1 family membrane protein insertase [Armatimonadota bacterium]
MLLFYCLSMYLSQKLTVTDPETAKKQAVFNIMMPAMFTYIMWKGNFPSALILYWLVFNILTIVQQYFILERPKRS